MDIISEDGVETNREKIKAMAEWPQQQNVKQIQSFLGFCNYYRNFIENFSEIAYLRMFLKRKNSSLLKMFSRF